MSVFAGVCVCGRVCVCPFFEDRSIVSLFICVWVVLPSLLSHYSFMRAAEGLIKSSLSPPDIGVSVKSPQIFHLHFSFPKRKRQEEESFGLIPVQRGDSKDWWFILVQHS